MNNILDIIIDGFRYIGQIVLVLVKSLLIWILWGVIIPMVPLGARLVELGFINGENAGFFDTIANTAPQVFGHGEMIFIAIGLLVGTMREVLKNKEVIGGYQVWLGFSLPVLMFTCFLGDHIYFSEYQNEMSKVVVSILVYLACVFASCLNLSVVEITKERDRLATSQTKSA